MSDTCLLDLFIEGLEEYFLKSSFNPSIDMNSKPFVPILLRYKNLVISKKKYLNWLCSDSVAIGLMQDTIEFS